MSDKYLDEHLDREAAKREFENPICRRIFIQRVFIIVSIQWLITFGVMVFVMNHEQTNLWIRYHHDDYLRYFIGLLLACMMLALAFVEKCRRTYPINYIVLLTCTLCAAYLVSDFGIFHKPEVVVKALGTTAVVVTLIALFANQPIINYTSARSILCAGIGILVILTIAGFMFPSHMLWMVVCSFGAIVFSMYLVLDIQMIMRGERMFVMHPDDYIFGALSIYVDVYFILLFILMLFSGDD